MGRREIGIAFPSSSLRRSRRWSSNWVDEAITPGLFDQGQFLEALEERPEGFVPGDAAVTPQVSKRAALARMEETGSSVLPVVDVPSHQLVGVLERSRLTASLILEITAGLEETE